MADRGILDILMTGPLPPAIGGVASLISNLAASSLSRNVRLELFNTGKTTPQDRPLYQGVAARAKLLYRWWRKLSSLRQSIVHIHSCSGLTFFLDGMILLIARWRGHPVVLHMHGGFFDQFLDSLSRPLMGIVRYITRCATCFVVLSDEWQAKLSSRLPGIHFLTILNGVPAFPRAGGSHSQTEFTVLFLGSLSINKGLPELLEALRKLPPHIQLEVAGNESEPGFAKWLREKSVQLGIEARTRFTGPVVGLEKAECLRRADLFVLPSHAEGLPIALLEAMAAGLPVVASSVGGIPSVICDRIHGRLVTPGKVDQLAEAIEELCLDSGKRAAMAEAAYQRWRERFDIEQTVAELLCLYQSIASRHSQKSRESLTGLSQENPTCPSRKGYEKGLR